MTNWRALALCAGFALSAFAAAQWSDNFDSYTAGSDIHGQGGWKGWNNSPTNGGTIVTTPNLSSPNSLQDVNLSDIVHEFSGITSGQWRFTANVFVPTNFTVTNEVAWFILLSNYSDGGDALGTDHWSVQLQMTSAGQVQDVNPGSGTGTTLIRNQWVPITVDVDLTNNTRVVKYNGVTVRTGTWTDGTGGTANIGAVDLYANNNGVSGNTIPVFYDNLSLAPVPEPASMAGLALGAIALLRRRRRQS